MLILVVSVLAGLIAVLLILVATRPADFRIVRSANIAASSGEVFAQVNDLHRWNAWSPWGKMDPDAK